MVQVSSCIEQVSGRVNRGLDGQRLRLETGVPGGREARVEEVEKKKPRLGDEPMKRVVNRFGPRVSVARVWVKR